MNGSPVDRPCIVEMGVSDFDIMFEIGFRIGFGKVWARRLVQTLSKTYLGCPRERF